MINGQFRPWGPIRWLMPKLPKLPWDVIGGLAVEDRCLGILRHYGTSFAVNNTSLLNIEDPASQFSTECEARKTIVRTDLAALGVANCNVLQFPLLGAIRPLKAAVDGIIAKSSGRIIFDVSALPKRIFFPVLRWLIESNDVKDLVVTYTSPGQYHKGELAFEPGDWAHLPTFQRIETPPLKKSESVIVGVGFIPFGLPGLLKDNHADADIVLIFPFPPGAPQFQRTWRFVTEIESISPLRDDHSIRRVDVNDISACFDEIGAITNFGALKTVFAPYGPKPHSVAMCLFAIKHNCDVFYTQPRYYHPNYSIGMTYDSGLPAGSAYLIKTDGNSLF